MIKRIVHIEQINIQGEKRQFQIKLPLNAKRILQIHATGNVAVQTIEKRIMIFPPDLGWLWLRISELRDVFYTEIIKLPIRNHNQTFEAHRPIDDFGNGTFWTQGKQEEFYDISADLDTNLLEGYYVDRIGTGLGKSYELKIYLTIEI